MRKSLALVTALFASTATLAAPENGWWWNPAEPGTGYNIETQNGTLFVSTFVDGGSGNPVWYSGSGQLNRNNMATINLSNSEVGQCLGCKSTSISSSDSGFQITLSFQSRGQGKVIIDGKEKPIERRNFNYGGDLQKLLGRWSLMIVDDGVFGLGFGDFISYDSIDGKFVEGVRLMNGSQPSTVISTDDGKYIGLIALRNGFEAIIYFGFSALNRVGGLFAIIDEDATASEGLDELERNGVLFIGYRMTPGSRANQKSSNLSSLSTQDTLVSQDMRNFLEEVIIHSADISLPSQIK
ncbi:hypothetical protein Nhal_2266 [Nitrosococcus halophilus Nc 4]|uniref:Uncharacterized protein n=2 Tax=Nitrosococcus halophilus TaxID=133539 RepID=D5BV04_NITHN|nr:hypothetical protein Nhal_2266 [Nitrosococcus halophilus Nc 4]